MALSLGAKIPDFKLKNARSGQETALAAYAGKKLALLFVPTELPEATLVRLGEYQNNLPAFAEAGAELVVITPAAAAGLEALTGLTVLLDPAGEALKSYRTLDAGGQVLPTAYLVGEDGVVKVVYEAERFPNLPGAPVVTRAARRLALAPSPGQVTPEDWVQGSPSAPVVLIEFSDYQCPHCMESHAALSAVLPKYAGKVALVHRHLPLRATHPQAQLAAEAAEAAGAQGKFWAMHDKLFDAHGELDRARISAFAAELGLDLARFEADLDGQRFKANVDDDFNKAVQSGIKLPPTLFLNGVPVDLPHTPESLSARIESLI